MTIEYRSTVYIEFIIYILYVIYVHAILYYVYIIHTQTLNVTIIPSGGL